MAVTVNGVPAAAAAAEPSGSELFSTHYRQNGSNRRLQQLPVPVCVNISTSTKWQTDFTATFLVPYEAGELRAILVHPPPSLPAASQWLGQASLAANAPRTGPPSLAFRTAGPPASLRLSVDQSVLRASRDDLAYIRAEVIDTNGFTVHCGVTPADAMANAVRSTGSLHGARQASHLRIVAPADDQPQRWYDDNRDDDKARRALGEAVPASATEGETHASVPHWCAPVLVSFAVEGAGEITAVGNGDPTDLGSFTGLVRKTYRGRAYAVVRPGQAGADGHVAAGGTITVTAESAGLKGASITLSVGAERPAHRV